MIFCRTRLHPLKCPFQRVLPADLTGFCMCCIADSCRPRFEPDLNEVVSLVTLFISVLHTFQNRSKQFERNGLMDSRSSSSSSSARRFIRNSVMKPVSFLTNELPKLPFRITSIGLWKYFSNKSGSSAYGAVRTF